LVLGVGCYATPQVPQAGAAPEKSTDGSGSSDGKAGKDATTVQPAAPWEDRENSVGLHLLKNIAGDQKALWDGPKSLRWVDADWLVPLGGATAALFVTDTDFSRHLSNSPNRIKYSKDVSNYGLASLVGIGGGMYVWGHFTHDDHKIETGILAGEAAIDSLVPVEGMKYALGRERPLQDNYQGQFFKGGVSFPSEHAAAAWSIASVIAHEYPGPLTSILAYSLASAISVSRLTAKQHFPSDVLVGSAIGWLEGMYVYRKHHDPRVGGGEWETYAEKQESGGRSTDNLGSPYVPPDSWVYPAMERLAGLGALNDEFMGMRPWTRSECARILTEAADRVNGGPAEAQRIYQVLETEFKEELEGASTAAPFRARLESIYTRFTNISGQPLASGYTGYNFGQTLINDFGRPYEEGFNSVTGFSAWTTAGRWVGYVRGEYQRSPSAPALSESARIFINEAITSPTPPPATPISSVSQLQLLDAYVGLNFNNYQVTFGQQSLWWGPGNGGPMLFSNNAPPIRMFRINRITPLELPRFLHWLGPMRTEFFFGQLTGQEFVFSPLGLVGQFGQSLDPQPFIHGQMISFKPTSNFEFAFFRTTIYGGPGYPLTFHHLISSLFSTGNEAAGGPTKPGDRRSGLSFSYRLPRLRNWLTLYGDGFTDDEFSPIAYVDVSAWHAGLYLSHFPRVSRLDLRVEGVYTDVPGGTFFNTKYSGSFYHNATWRNGYTNNGDLIGSWIGRGGQGAQAWTNYWFSPRNRLQFYFRHQKVSQEFIPGGGSLTDAGVRTDYSLRSNLSLSVSVQHERWLFPVIQPNAARNVTASVGISFEPQKIFRSSQADTADEPRAKGGLP
jgi:hypothetical protein